MVDRYACILVIVNICFIAEFMLKPDIPDL